MIDPKWGLDISIVSSSNSREKDITLHRERERKNPLQSTSEVECQATHFHSAKVNIQIMSVQSSTEVRRPPRDLRDDEDDEPEKKVKPIETVFRLIQVENKCFSLISIPPSFHNST